jgi:hypothetical protein
MSVPFRPIVLAVMLLMNAAASYAHSLAGTMISVVADRPGIVSVTIEAEADPLIAKLDTLAGVVASESILTNAERRRRLESLFPTLRTHIDGRVDGNSLEFALRDVTVDDTAHVTIRLTTPVPDGPHTFTWKCTFIFGAYQLVATSGDAGEAVQWIQGPQTSTPIALEPSDAQSESLAPGPLLTRMGHGLAMGALVVYVLTRRRTGQRPAGG